MRLADVIDALNFDPYLDSAEKTACAHIARILARSAKGRRDCDHLPLGPLEQRRIARLIAAVTIAIDDAEQQSPGYIELVGGDAL